jgi:outer membrane protein assembly factor BamD (BamD/ComL family)
LDSLKSVSPEKIQPLIFQRLLFDYVKDNNPKEAAVFINKFITAQSKSVELPSMIYDLATLLLKKPEYSTESENNLLYLLKNYPKSLYEEPARKLLRKIKSRRVG